MESQGGTGGSHERTRTMADTRVGSIDASLHKEAHVEIENAYTCTMKDTKTVSHNVDYGK